MKTKQLIGHMEGSFLKEQYLEAFLVQSAFIEGLIKSYTMFNFYLETKKVLDNSPMSRVFLDHFDRYGLYKLTEMLHESKHITGEQKKMLDEYRK